MLLFFPSPLVTNASSKSFGTVVPPFLVTVASSLSVFECLPFGKMKMLWIAPPSLTWGFGYSFNSLVTFSNSSTFGVEVTISSSSGVVVLTLLINGLSSYFKISITFTTTILLSSAIFLISVKRAVISSGYLSSVPSIKIVTTKVSSDGALLTN